MATFNLLSASLLEKILQKLIKLDPQAQQRLKELEGKVVSIELKDWQQTFHLSIEQDNLWVSSHHEGESHVTMSGTSFAFFNLAIAEKGGDAFFKGDIHFSGEVGSAQKFQLFWQSLHIDWEEELAHYTGDILAYHIGQVARGLGQFGSKLTKTAQLNFSECIKEEARLTPDPIEVDAFFDELDDLKSDVNRLEARICHLQTKVNL